MFGQKIIFKYIFNVYIEYPERRKFHSCFTIGNYIYVFGGICTVGNSVFNMRTKMVPNFVWRLDMRELRWQKLDIKIPVMTYFHGACEHVNESVSIVHEINSILDKNYFSCRMDKYLFMVESKWWIVKQQESTIYIQYISQFPS